MALVVETGAGVAGADSYVDLAYADSWHEARGRAAWQAVGETAREQALRRAADALDAGWRFIGQRVSAVQARSWPRVGAVWPDGTTVEAVPEPVKQAQCELALRALEGDILPDLARGGRVVKSAERVDQVEQSVEYEPGAPAGMVYVLVDRLLADLLVPAGGRYLERG